MNKETTALTIFDAIGEQERAEAIKAFLSGRTPQSEIQERDGRGGTRIKYVKTYYMTRQITLLTGSRWSHENTEERARPNWDDPIEVGVKVRITVWDSNSTAYSHTAWGQKDVARFKAKYGKDNKVLNPDQANKLISIFDDLKAAESDGIKKALSYFGIANDVYGGKEFEFFEETGEGEEQTEYSIKDAQRALDKYLQAKGKTWTWAFGVLGVKGLTEVTDYTDAYGKLKEALGGKDNNGQ